MQSSDNGNQPARDIERDIERDIGKGDTGDAPATPVAAIDADFQSMTSTIILEDTMTSLFRDLIDWNASLDRLERDSPRTMK
jgi:hypothetical protein